MHLPSAYELADLKRQIAASEQPRHQDAERLEWRIESKNKE
jgi:hypothetical protein